MEQNGIKYISIVHSPAYTAQQVAQSVHISGHDLAKTVIVKIEDRLAMAVLPADRKVSIEELRELTGSEHVTFASEQEFERAFPDCEIGAMPPFGNLYGMETFLAPELAGLRDIAFNAGTHTEVIKLAFSDFERLVHPKIISFAA